MRINDQIVAREVRLIDHNGQNQGIVPLRVAIDRANQVNLDLMEVGGQGAGIPVCKILDYGKFKYAEAKKKSEAKKNQKITETKEIKLRPGIDKHDYEIKARAIKQFLDEGDKVKITIRFRGREMAHAEIGVQLMDKIREDFKAIAKIDGSSQLDGKQMNMLLTSAGAAKAEALKAEAAKQPA